MYAKEQVRGEGRIFRNTVQMNLVRNHYCSAASDPSSPYCSSQEFPADAAVATVSKDNTFSWICTRRFNASAAYVQQNLGWGVQCVTILAHLRSGLGLKNHSS